MTHLASSTNNKDVKIENRTIFLVLQGTYSETEVALFKEENLLDSIQDCKIYACKNLVSSIDLLLKKHKMTLNQISFIAANSGPGPFTTLRTIIATVNGLNFATKIPLIPINGITTLANEFYNSKFNVNIALLNAFCNDIYYCIKQGNNISFGKENIEIFLKNIKKNKTNKTINLFGQGSVNFQKIIETILGNKINLDSKKPEFCSINSVGKLALKKWNNNEYSKEKILPLYIKNPIINQI